MTVDLRKRRKILKIMQIGEDIGEKAFTLPFLR